MPSMAIGPIPSFKVRVICNRYSARNILVNCNYAYTYRFLYLCC